MTDILKPRNSKDVEDAVRWAVAEGKALDLIGHGSKRTIGRPAQTDLTLELSGLTGVTLYEPEELVLTARAGTPIAEIETLVTNNNQQLAFEPMDFSHLLGGAPGLGSIGGVLAANLSGPRRLKSGAARDHFLGVAAVSGRGETFKSGGRVVKNVTGYDLCKLMAGSWGTLAAMTEVTIKTLPRPETESSVVLRGLDDAKAVSAMTAAMASPCDVSGAAHMSAEVAGSTPLATAVASGRSLTVLRLEGVAPSVAHRKMTLTQLVRSFGEVGTIEDMASRELWRAVRDVTPFAASRTGADQPLWRVSTTAAKGAAFARMVAGGAESEFLYDWAGGLVWVLLRRAGADAGAALIRRAVTACGGHATLIRAPTALRAIVDVFEPQAPGLAALTRRVKEGFDPNGVLNPGRMWAGV